MRYAAGLLLLGSALFGQEHAVLDNLQHRAERALAAIHHARTAAEADAARSKLRAQLTESLGFRRLPPPAARGARVVGKVVRPGYRIEKIAWESIPGVKVPAHMYLPERIEGRAPAVLFYVGHWWPDSKARPDFQAFCINMARLGFVVLTWDPFGQGERGISSRDHRRVESLLAGVAQQGIAEYETQCALEYLLSRKEVDPQRIGMTGASGGGYNTWITSALDDRIKVAVPVVGTSEFYEQISVTRALDWYHASEHCHFVPGLITYANNHEFVAMVAPRPLLIVSALKDQSFPVEGVRTIAAYSRDLYRAYGIPEKASYYEDSTEGHGYQQKKREAAYGWFLRWLMQRGDGQPHGEPATQTEPYDSAELRVFEEKQPAGPGIVAAMKALLPAKPAGHLPHGSEDDLRLAVTLRKPGGRIRGLLVTVDDRGRETADATAPEGWAVAAVDPRGIGEMATTKMGWVAAVSLLLGENFVEMQGWDIRRAMALVPGVPVRVRAQGPNATLAAAYAIAREPRVESYTLTGGFRSLRDFIDRPESLAKSYELRADDKDRTTAFDREIPFAWVPWRGLLDFDIPQLLHGRGEIRESINGDWK